MPLGLNTKYRVPAIVHRPTNTKLMDAIEIIDFLNLQYAFFTITPSPPELEAHFRYVMMALYQVVVVPRILLILSPRSALAYRRDHEAMCKHPLEDYLAKEDEYWERYIGDLRQLGEALLLQRGKKHYLYSDFQPSMLDLLIAGTMLGARVVHEDVYLRTLDFPGFSEMMMSCIDLIEN